LCKNESRDLVFRLVTMAAQKTIAQAVHDHKKPDLLAWTMFNSDLLAQDRLMARGTTGTLLEGELKLPVIRLQSGPLGGDQQIGAKITKGEIEFLIFFWDPLEPQPHDPGIKAPLRIAVVWNTPVLCNRASADFMMSSSLLPKEYIRLVPDSEEYRA